MSGPKISLYNLSEKERKSVLGQFRCEQKSVLLAGKTSALLNACCADLQQVSAILSRLHLLEQRTGKGAEKAAYLTQLLHRAEQEIGSIKDYLSKHQPQMSANYDPTAAALAEKQKMLSSFQNFHTCAAKLQKELSAAASESEEDRSQAVQEIRSSISEDLAGVCSFEIFEEAPASGFEEQKRALTHRLMELAAADHSLEINQKIRHALETLAKISDEAHLSAFSAVTVKNLLNEVRAHAALLETRKAELTDLAERYQLLCQMTGTVPRKFPYSPHAAAEITAEIEALEQVIYKQHEQSYISQCVDEVLEDMGYALIGSREVKKKNGKQFKNELFAFHNGTAVNVTYASDGQIAMELGGLSREDRVPTVEETAVLTEDMESFCGEFAEFERRLREKGIEPRKRIALSPPSADYASIINLNDYNIRETAEIAELSVSSKKKKAAAKKHMQEKQ